MLKQRKTNIQKIAEARARKAAKGKGKGKVRPQSSRSFAGKILPGKALTGKKGPDKTPESTSQLPSLRKGASVGSPKGRVPIGYKFHTCQSAGAPLVSMKVDGTRGALSMTSTKLNAEELKREKKKYKKQKKERINRQSPVREGSMGVQIKYKVQPKRGPLAAQIHSLSLPGVTRIRPSPSPQTSPDNSPNNSPACAKKKSRNK